MSTDVQAAPLGEIRAATTAGGGTALTTIAQYIALPNGTKHIFMRTRNYAGGCEVVQFSLNPWLAVLKSDDNLATPPVDYSELAQDGSTSTSVDLSSLDTLANGDFLLVGSHLPFSGVSLNINTANVNGSVLTVTYWNGTAWTTISATDNTASGGASIGFAATNNKTVTWTVPTPWYAATLREIFNRVTPSVLDAVYNSPSMVAYCSEKLYWTRWEWDAALDSTTTVTAMLALNRNSVRAELVEGEGHSRRIHRGLHGIGAVVALTDAGTASLIINADSGNGGRFV